MIENQEIWIKVKNFEEFYEVSNYGNIKRLPKKIKGISNSFRILKEKILKPRYSGKQYLMVTLTKNNEQFNKKVHRLVAEHFIPNPENKPQVNHLDGNKENNQKENLEWVTNRENKNHYYSNASIFGKYRGVYYNKTNKKWRSRIKINNETINLGYFTTEEEAGLAYINAKNRYNIIDKYS